MKQTIKMLWNLFCAALSIPGYIWIALCILLTGDIATLKIFLKENGIM